MASSADSILKRLAIHADTRPNRPAFTFLHRRHAPEALTFGDLAIRVHTLATFLRQRASAGDRVILLYPSGLEFICAFLACLVSRLIAVPCPLPRRETHDERLAGVLTDCSPTIALTTHDHLHAIESHLVGRDLSPIASDLVVSERDRHCAFGDVSDDDIAFLQYTSGSTRSPRGVIVTHGSLSSNEVHIQSRFGHGGDPAALTGVNWLPLFHDMGLIGNVLQPLYVGFHSVLMGPTDFMHDPYRWLHAISTYRATTAGAPNFAFDLCVKTVDESRKATLDLSCLRVMYNGSEPLRPETLDRFTASFAPCGFSAKAWLPCYGLAEATLFVSGGPFGREVERVCASPRALERGHFRKALDSRERRVLVSSGRAAPGMRIAVVDAQTRRILPDGQVGELWLQSASVAAGYWNRDRESRDTFANRLANGDGPFLRTGDLGFLESEELFVTGRSGDLILVRGRNVWPQDIEAAVEGVLSRSGPGTTAAFAFDRNGREAIAAVVEADRGLARQLRKGRDETLTSLVGDVRQAVEAAAGVLVDVVVVVAPGTLPRTSSGKVRRAECRRRFESGALVRICQWSGDMAAQDAIVDATSTIALKRQQRRYAIATLILPIVGMLVLIAALWGTWVTPIDLVLLAVMYTATTIGVSVGFHRLFTHRSFATRPMIRVVLAVLGSMAAEGSLIFWVAAHRRHHRYSDRHGDPHSPHLYAPGLWGRLRGLWHAHAGWLYRHEPTDVTVYAKDLIRDPTMRRVSHAYLWCVALGLAIPPLAAGAASQSYVGAARGLFWGGFARMFLAHHFTWSVNSICHSFGFRAHETPDQSRNNIWLAIPTMGEAWHNNHHDAPAVASFQRQWWQVDLGAFVILVLEKAGLAWNVKKAADRRRPVGHQQLQTTKASEALAMLHVPDQQESNGADLKATVHAVVLRWLKAEANFRGASVGYDTPLTAVGLDSIGTAVIAADLEKATGAALGSDDLYRHPTIAALADCIQKKLPDTAAPRRTQPLCLDAPSPVTVDPLGDSMASFASPRGRTLADRVRPYALWQGARRQAAMWPFYRVAQTPAAPTTAIAGGDGAASPCLNFASQDYLGLTRDARVLRAAQVAVAQYGIHSAGSPVLLGTTTPMVELERALASAVDQEDALVFATGWAAGFGVLTGLIRNYDSLVLDSRCHRCLADGAIQAVRDPLFFRHNDLDHLQEILEQARSRDAHNGLFIVAESLYSMDSDSPDLAAMVRLVHRFDGIMILDVAHDFGAMGRRGKGLLETLEATDGHVDVVMGSFSKTFAATGGFVAASRPVVDYLRGHARGYLINARRGTVVPSEHGPD